MSALTTDYSSTTCIVMVETYRMMPTVRPPSVMIEIRLVRAEMHSQSADDPEYDNVYNR